MHSLDSFLRKLIPLTFSVTSRHNLHPILFMQRHLLPMNKAVQTFSVSEAYFAPHFTIETLGYVSVEVHVFFFSSSTLPHPSCAQLEQCCPFPREGLLLTGVLYNSSYLILLKRRKKKKSYRLIVDLRAQLASVFCSGRKVISSTVPLRQNLSLLPRSVRK